MLANHNMPEKRTSAPLSAISFYTAMFSCFILFITLLTFSNAAQSVESKETGAISYIKLEPMIVNLHDLSQYLQVKVTLKIADAKTADFVKNLTPAIRHRLILLLSDQKADDLASTQNKKKIMSSIRYDLNKYLNLNQNEGVSAVLFESFIIQ